MKFFTPTFRSRRYGDRFLKARDVFLVGLVTWLTPALVGVLFLGVTVLLPPTADFDSPWAIVGIAAGFLLFSPIYGVVLVPLGLLLGAWAMRLGYAGWTSAVGSAILIPVGGGALFYLINPQTEGIGIGLIIAPVVLVHALAMWSATRYFCPKSLMDPEASSVLS